MGFYDMHGYIHRFIEKNYTGTVSFTCRSHFEKIPCHPGADIHGPHVLLYDSWDSGLTAVATL
jgi:hypothetical protein